MARVEVSVIGAEVVVGWVLLINQRVITDAAVMKTKGPTGEEE